MNRSMFVSVCSLLAVLTVSGCKTTQAPLAQSGQKVHIDVLVNRGDPNTMESKQWGWRNEIGEFMEPNLVRRLGDYGFSSAQIQKASDFKGKPDSYLLSVKIKSYNPGSSAARILVGYGAGACALDCHYELMDAQGKKVLDWDDGCGSSSDWRRLPVKLNQNTGRKIVEYLAVK
ncbi:MAG: DUF4410 domain-containing protein [Kiritimatiellales bacterium]|nr:DUF4410 domain-containing protein [Kiritimatiellales bacterium]